MNIFELAKNLAPVADQLDFDIIENIAREFANSALLSDPTILNQFDTSGLDPNDQFELVVDHIISLITSKRGWSSNCIKR